MRRLARWLYTHCSAVPRLIIPPVITNLGCFRPRPIAYPSEAATMPIRRPTSTTAPATSPSLAQFLQWPSQAEVDKFPWESAAFDLVLDRLGTASREARGQPGDAARIEEAIRDHLGADEVAITVHWLSPREVMPTVLVGGNTIYWYVLRRDTSGGWTVHTRYLQGVLDSPAGE